MPAFGEVVGSHTGLPGYKALAGNAHHGVAEHLYVLQRASKRTKDQSITMHCIKWMTLLMEVGFPPVMIYANYFLASVSK